MLFPPLRQQTFRPRSKTVIIGGTSSLVAYYTSAVSQVYLIKTSAVRRRIHFKLTLNNTHLTMKISCPTCERTFTRKYNLTHHINAKHVKREYPCPNCWRVFSRKNNLQRHIKTHKDIMETQNTEVAAQYYRSDTLTIYQLYTSFSRSRVVYF